MLYAKNFAEFMSKFALCFHLSCLTVNVSIRQLVLCGIQPRIATSKKLIYDESTGKMYVTILVLEVVSKDVCLPLLSSDISQVSEWLPLLTATRNGLIETTSCTNWPSDLLGRIGTSTAVNGNSE